MKPPSAPPSTYARKNKRTHLTLAQRIKVIQKNSSGVSIKALTAEFGAGSTQISDIIKNKADIMARWEAGEDGSRKLSVVRVFFLWKLSPE